MQVDFAVISPSGIGLGIHAWLTGKIDIAADGFTVASVEIWFMASCARLEPDGLHDIKGPSLFSPVIEKALWVKPDDLCIAGVPIKHEELIAEAARVREEVQKRAAEPLLGRDWP